MEVGGSHPCTDYGSTGICASGGTYRVLWCRDRHALPVTRELVFEVPDRKPRVSMGPFLCPVPTQAGSQSIFFFDSQSFSYSPRFSVSHPSRDQVREICLHQGQDPLGCPVSPVRVPRVYTSLVSTLPSRRRSRTYTTGVSLVRTTVLPVLFPTGWDCIWGSKGTGPGTAGTLRPQTTLERRCGNRRCRLDWYPCEVS